MNYRYRRAFSLKAITSMISHPDTCTYIQRLFTEVNRKDVENENFLGYIRQLAQVLEQERAVVDGPESTLYTNASQRAHTIKGLQGLGLETTHLLEKYQQLFNEDFARLIAEFDNAQNVSDDWYKVYA